MKLRRMDFPAGYVKVEVRSRSALRWGWSVFSDIGTVVAKSDNLFRYADDAWAAGQVALAAIPPCTICDRDLEEDLRKPAAQCDLQYE